MDYHAQQRKQKGFSLIELMITVAIVGIIAAVAYPSYQESVRKGRRADAHSALTDMASRQEQYFMDNKTYADTLAKLGMSASSSESFYALSITNASATTYTAVATPQNAQAKDSCGKLSVNELGTRTPADCW